jgi:hypothetical protein
VDFVDHADHFGQRLREHRLSIIELGEESGCLALAKSQLFFECRKLGRQFGLARYCIPCARRDRCKFVRLLLRFDLAFLRVFDEPPIFGDRSYSTVCPVGRVIAIFDPCMSICSAPFSACMPSAYVSHAPMIFLRASAREWSSSQCSQIVA